MNQATLQNQGLSIERIAEIERIEAELSKAFVQAAIEYAYARATGAVPQVVDRTVVARSIDQRALELAHVRLTDPRTAAALLPTKETAHAMKARAHLDERQVKMFRDIGDAFGAEALKRVEALANSELRSVVGTQPVSQRQLAPAAVVLERTGPAQADFDATIQGVRESPTTRATRFARAELQAHAMQQPTPGEHADPAKDLRTAAEMTRYSPEEQARILREKMEREDAERVAETIARWNDLAAWEAYRRSRRAQTEIEAGGDPARWQAYAMADDAMVRGLQAPELVRDGTVNGATTQRYQPQVTQHQTRAVNEEVREELTSEPTNAARTLVSIPFDRSSAERSPERGIEHDYGHRFEPLHEPGTTGGE